MRWAYFAVIAATIVGLGLSKRGFLRSDSPEAVRRGWPLAALDVLFVAVFFALFVGLAEVMVTLFAQRVLEKFVFWSLSAAWLTPVAYLVLFTIPAVPLVLIASARPRWMPIQLLAFLFSLAAFGSLAFSFPRIHPLASGLLALGFAVRTAQVAGAAPGRFRAVVYAGSAVLALAVGGVAYVNLSADARERAALEGLPPAAERASNVLILVLDTVRAASLSLYGHGRPTTPSLDRLALESVVFDQAIATAPWTLPTHGSLFTGHHPFEMSAGFRKPLDGSQKTLAEHFRDRGYATAGIVANRHYTSAESGLDRGFIHYRDYLGAGESLFAHAWLGNTLGVQTLLSARSAGEILKSIVGFSLFKPERRESKRRSAADINDAFLTWLDQQEERPFFGFLNYFDAHRPYEPPEPYRTQFQLNDGVDLGRRGLRQAQGLYEGSIAYLDEQIGDLLEELDARGLLDNTLLVVTSDHGEQFGEHGGGGHGNSLFTEVLRVPLMIRYPDRAPANVRVSSYVSLRDVPATVAALATPDADHGFPGASLTRHWNGSIGPASDELLLSELTMGPSGTARTLGPTESIQLKSLIDGRYHYIWGRQEGLIRERLFDLSVDPTEQNDLVKNPDAEAVLRRLAGSLADMFPTPGSDTGSR